MTFDNSILLHVYFCLTMTAGILIIWTASLIQRLAFFVGHEPAWIREFRRASLILVGVGLMLTMKWHVTHGRGPWPGELLIVTGIDVYLALAIKASYARLRHYASL